MQAEHLLECQPTPRILHILQIFRLVDAVHRFRQGHQPIVRPQGGRERLERLLVHEVKARLHIRADHRACEPGGLRVDGFDRHIEVFEQRRGVDLPSGRLDGDLAVHGIGLPGQHRLIGVGRVEKADGQRRAVLVHRFEPVDLDTAACVDRAFFRCDRHAHDRRSAVLGLGYGHGFTVIAVVARQVVQQVIGRYNAQLCVDLTALLPDALEISDGLE